MVKIRLLDFFKVSKMNCICIFATVWLCATNTFLKIFYRPESSHWNIFKEGIRIFFLYFIHTVVLNQPQKDHPSLVKTSGIVCILMFGTRKPRQDDSITNSEKENLQSHKNQQLLITFACSIQWTLEQRVLTSCQSSLLALVESGNPLLALQN